MHLAINRESIRQINFALHFADKKVHEMNCESKLIVEYTYGGNNESSFHVSVTLFKLLSDYCS